MKREEAIKHLSEIPGWELDVHADLLRRQFLFTDFKEAMKFVNRVADLAEQEGHHPDIAVSWNKVTLTLTTHAMKGLSENDFIVAAKVGEMEGR